MNISEASRHSQLPIKTIRYYEDIGLIPEPARLENGYRDFSQQDVEQLQFLNHARSVGFSIEDCRELMSLYGDPARQSAHVKSLVLEKVALLEQQLESLNAMRETLLKMASRCHGDESPQCAIIDELTRGPGQ